jgi:ABC-2 type transport system ATP-binding protein
VKKTSNELFFEARAEGRTVFLSSHIISEVERTCDRVAIIRDGRIVRVDTVEGVRALAAHEVELRFAAPVAAAPFQALAGVVNLVEEGRTLRMLVTGPMAPVVRLAGQYDLVDFVSREPSLEDVFLSEYESRAPAPVATR